MREIRWYPVEKYEDLYEISDEWQVKDLRTGEIISTGHELVTLSRGDGKWSFRRTSELYIAAKSIADIVDIIDYDTKVEVSKRKNKGTKKNKGQTEFVKIRKLILARDAYKCVECGSDEGLNVHHIKHRKHGGDNSAENLETLCRACHRKKHEGEPVQRII